MTKICLIVLIGIPGVGKSELCNFILKYLNSSNVHVNYISYDDYEANSTRNLYKNFRSNVYNQVKNIVENILFVSKNAPVVNENLILIDDNMYYRSMRRHYYTLAKEFKISFCQIYVTCSIETAIIRNGNRSLETRIPNDVIYDMAKKIEPPLNNNIWEKYSVVINSENPFNTEDCLLITNKIQESLENPIIMHVSEPNNHVSFIHTVDLMLRSIVKSMLKNKNKNSMEQVSKHLCRKKKFILNGLKNNEIFLSDFDDNEKLYQMLVELVEDICV